jgi:hypothetical protein
MQVQETKFANAQQAKQIYQYENIKGNFLDTYISGKK